MTLKNIAIIGANGTLGPSILHALITAQTFNITVLSRHSSKSTYPSSVRVIYLADTLPNEELVSSLRGQDALVVCFAGTNDDLQIRLADCAAAAGVKRFIPADFGSCDSSSARALALMPLYVAKKKVREHLQRLASAGAGSTLSWTSVVCGHFFDYGLRTGGLLSVDLKARRLRVYDDGEVRWSTSTLSRIGLAVVRVLQREEETRDRMLFVQSFCVSQNQLLASLRRATATEGEEWRVERVGSESFIVQMKGEIDRDEENAETRESLVSVVGIIESNWERRKGFANHMLGLEEEDLDKVVDEVVRNV